MLKSHAPNRANIAILDAVIFMYRLVRVCNIAPSSHKLISCNSDLIFFKAVSLYNFRKKYHAEYVYCTHEQKISYIYYKNLFFAI